MTKPDFLSLPLEARADVLRAAAGNLGRDAKVLEKDVWVCWALRELFSLPDP